MEGIVLFKKMGVDRNLRVKGVGKYNSWNLDANVTDHHGFKAADLC